jgi:predicted O-methyltransferase YrrM
MESLLNLDYSNPCVTCKSHILAIHCLARYYSSGTALEIGSFQGHATLALASAGLRVISYDIDTEYISQRESLLKDFDVEWNKMRSDHSLLDTRSFDIIFHDADHGNKIVHELEALWPKVKVNGLFVIHDFEQITIPVSFTNCIYKTKDVRGRELAIFRKGETI